MDTKSLALIESRGRGDGRYQLEPSTSPGLARSIPFPAHRPRLLPSSSLLLFMLLRYASLVPTLGLRG